MQSTQALASDRGCTVQAINKARRKAEREHNLKLGTPDPRDKRITLFSPHEAALILQYAPLPKISETDSEPSFTVSELDSETLYDYAYEDCPDAPPLMQVVKPMALAKNPTLLPAKAPEIVADTGVLSRGIHAAKSATAFSANELMGYVEGFVDARFDTMLTTLEHAITAMGATALNKKVQALAEPTQQTQSTHRSVNA